MKNLIKPVVALAAAAIMLSSYKVDAADPQAPVVQNEPDKIDTLVNDSLFIYPSYWSYDRSSGTWFCMAKQLPQNCTSINTAIWTSLGHVQLPYEFCHDPKSKCYRYDMSSPPQAGQNLKLRFTNLHKRKEPPSCPVKFFISYRQP